jgi:hypothetical protein
MKSEMDVFLKTANDALLENLGRITDVETSLAEVKRRATEEVDIVKRYKSGESIQHIADALDRSYHGVRRDLLAAEVTLRRPGGRAGDHRRRVSLSVSVTELKRRYNEDKCSIRALAISQGVAYGTMHSILKNAGVTFRQRGGPRPRSPNK